MAGTVVGIMPGILSASPAGASPLYPECPAFGVDTGCAVLIVINAAGPPTILTDQSQLPFDGTEDTLVGVLNNSALPITSLPLSATGSQPIFAFDGDGFCAVGNTGCGLTGYEGSATGFTTSNTSTGTVNFSPGLAANSGYGYFALEGADVKSGLVVDQSISAAATAIAAQENILFSGAVASFTDPDVTDTGGTYTASIDWGDGTVTPGTIAGSAGSFAVSGSHTYTALGSDTAKVTITDGDGSGQQTSVSDAVSVGEAPIIPSPAQFTVAEGVALNGAVGGFADQNPNASVSDFSTTISWGDGGSSPGTVSLVSSSTAGTVFSVSGGHTYPTSSTPGSPYAVAIQVTDWDSGTPASTFVIASSATVTEQAITVNPTMFSPVQKGTPGFSGTVATISDPNLVGANDYTAQINWGDGTTGTGVVTAGTSAGQFNVSGSHPWTSAGTYSVTVTVKDPDTPSTGGSATSIITVYDIVVPCSGSCSSTDTGTGFSSVVNANTGTGTGTIAIGVLGTVACQNDPFHHAPATTTFKAIGTTGNITVRLRIGPKATKDLDPSHFDVCYTQTSTFKDIYGLPVTTGLLPSCIKTGGVAPCLVSRFENAIDGVTEVFIIPSGDPGWR